MMYWFPASVVAFALGFAMRWFAESAVIERMLLEIQALRSRIL